MLQVRYGLTDGSLALGDGRLVLRPPSHKTLGPSI